MFKHGDNYFNKIACPEFTEKKSCNVINCIFKHDRTDHSLKRPLDLDEKKEDQAKKHKPKEQIINTNGTIPELGAKPKEVISHEGGKKDISMIIPKTITHIQIPRSTRTVNTRKISSIYKEKNQPLPNSNAIQKEFETAISSKSIQEYESKIDQLINKDRVIKVDPKYIIPKQITLSSPATLPERKKYIQAMVDTLKKVEPSLSTPILTSIEEEYKVATTNSSATYSQSFKKRLYQIAHPEKFKEVKKTPSLSELAQKLDELVIPKEKLKQYGYIMEIPEAVQPQQDRVCRRCNNEFKLNEILTPTKCHYHSGKVLKHDKNNRTYECCGGVVGSETDTCEVSENHVFYWSNPGEMQAFLPFQKTSEMFKPNKNSFKALGIDCEMGFTSKGFELLRVTAMDFFSGEEVIDILVKPLGEVIDLNTKWSGIAEIKEEAMSFEDLIALLNSIMDCNTILVGHGLENDMNSMRLIHDKIVDTAILYPKHQTTPTFRYPLKYLTFKYLGRTIQSGEHDSGEDSLAAIDVVKYFIGQDLRAIK